MFGDPWYWKSFVAYCEKSDMFQVEYEYDCSLGSWLQTTVMVFLCANDILSAAVKNVSIWKVIFF